MAIVNHYSIEQREAIAARIGSLLGIEDAGMKMTREGWRLESFGDEVQITVELVKIITPEEAEDILNARPID